MSDYRPRGLMKKFESHPMTDGTALKLVEKVKANRRRITVCGLQEVVHVNSTGDVDKMGKETDLSLEICVQQMQKLKAEGDYLPMGQGQVYQVDPEQVDNDLDYIFGK